LFEDGGAALQSGQQSPLGCGFQGDQGFRNSFAATETVSLVVFTGGVEATLTSLDGLAAGNGLSAH